MSEANDKIRERSKHRYSSSIAQDFYIQCKHHNIIVIVEGISDKNFYKNTNIEILNNAFYIFAENNSDIVRKKIAGKKAVIEAYFKIKEWSKRSPYNNSVVFIVDKDFFGINWEAPYYRDIVGAKDEDINNFTILDCHSHECYFILENNLKMIFKLLNIEDKLEQFNNILKENLDDFSEYYAYKSILEEENPRYPKHLRNLDDIKNIGIIDFNFEFNGNKLTFNKDGMQSSINQMKKDIDYSSNKENLKIQYLEMKQKFKIHPELLRGHTLYDFLECYLNYYGKTLKTYHKYNKEIIKRMEIPLDIKILKHSIGKYKLEQWEDNGDNL